MGAAASSRIRILRGWLPRQVGLLPARGGEKRIEGYARRSFWVAFFGRGFDSHHLHHLHLASSFPFPLLEEFDTQQPSLHASALVARGCGQRAPSAPTSASPTRRPYRLMG